MDDLCVQYHYLWRNHIGVSTTSRGRTIGPARCSRKGFAVGASRRVAEVTYQRPSRIAQCSGYAHSGQMATDPAPSGFAWFAARAPWRRLPHPLRWLTVALIGGTFIAIGIVLLVLPGPGIAFIILGLAILATEFVWAETLLHRVKDGGKRGLELTKSMMNGRKKAAASPPEN